MSTVTPPIVVAPTGTWTTVARNGAVVAILAIVSWLAVKPYLPAPAPSTATVQGQLDAISQRLGVVELAIKGLAPTPDPQPQPTPTPVPPGPTPPSGSATITVSSPNVYKLHVTVGDPAGSSGDLYLPLSTPGTFPVTFTAEAP